MRGLCKVILIFVGAICALSFGQPPAPAQAPKHRSTPDKTLPLSLPVEYYYRGKTPIEAAEMHKALAPERLQIAQQLTGQNVLLTRSLKGEQIAWAKTCEALRAEIVPMKTWKRIAEFDSLDPLEDVVKAAECTYSKEHGLFWMNVSDYLPSFAANCLGFQFPCDGPNCMNAALLSMGTCKAVRYSSVEEMLAVLNSGSCKKVDRADMQPGDIVAIGVGEPMKPHHAFTFVSDNVAFEKPSSNARELHRFLSPGTILKNWKIPEECYGRKGTDEQCPEGWAEIHRCETAFLIDIRQKEGESAPLKNVRAQADALELEKMDDYFFNTFNSPTIAPQELKRRVEDLLKNDAMAVFPADLLAAADEKTRTALLQNWNIQIQRVKSMLTQTELLSSNADEKADLERYQDLEIKAGVQSLLEKLETRADSAVTFPFVNAIAQKMQKNPDQTFAFIQRELPALLQSYDVADAAKVPVNGKPAARSRTWQARRALEIAAEVAEQQSQGAVQARIRQLKSSIQQAPVRKARKIN